MKRINRIIGLVAAALVVGSAGQVEGLATAASGLHPEIHAATAFRAPIGGKGGIESPYVSCSNARVSPRVRWALTNTGTGVSHTYRWRGALPGMYFPRVPVGTYQSKTTAWCRTVKAVRHQSLAVRRKTLETTISRAECRKVHRGMTRARVSRTVGYDGRYAGTYAGKTTRIYDMMAFWRWAEITYRDGRVVGKMWDVPHD